MSELAIVKPIEKKCTKCLVIKPLSSFYKDSKIKRDGKMARCRECTLEKNTKFFNSLPDAEKIKRRSKYSNSDLCRSYNYKKLYGITLIDAEKMLEAQMGLCANRSCGTEIELGIKVEAKRRAFVDHNHTTGKVRGILCMRCNTCLGWLEDKNKVMGLMEYMHKYDKPLNYLRD